MTEIPTEPGTRLRSRKSQDALDSRLTFIPRAQILLVVAMAFVILAAAYWSIFGSIPTKAKGAGILVREGQRMFSAEAQAEGMIARIATERGAFVKTGQILAETDQSELTLSIKRAKDRLAKLEDNLASREARLNAEVAVREQDIAEQEKVLTKQQRDSNTRSDHFAEAMLQTSLLRAKADLGDLQSAAQDRLDDLRLTVSDQRREIDGLEADLKRRLHVRSPASGVVEEVRIEIGDWVQPQDVLVTIASGGKNMEVLAFLRAREARRAKPGMPVHVVPSTVEKFEFGSVKGQVISVSEEPVSQSKINSVLGNQELAQQFASKDQLYLSRIKLMEAPQLPSGLQWWSGDGAPYRIKLGTLASVEVVVQEQPPIAFVVPGLRGLLNR
ncbi:MAG: HlyD family efflux transporter periplasmic adaptor subunit [Pseudomonadota bacterium]